MTRSAKVAVDHLGNLVWELSSTINSELDWRRADMGMAWASKEMKLASY